MRYGTQPIRVTAKLLALIFIVTVNTSSFGSCNSCWCVALNLLRSINQKVININKNMPACCGCGCCTGIPITGPTVIRQSGDYYLPVDTIGPIDVAADYATLRMCGNTLYAGEIAEAQVEEYDLNTGDMAAFLVGKGVRNFTLEGGGGKITASPEAKAKIKAKGGESIIYGVVIGPGVYRVEFADFDADGEIDRVISAAGTIEEPISQLQVANVRYRPSVAEVLLQGEYLDYAELEGIDIRYPVARPDRRPLISIENSNQVAMLNFKITGQVPTSKQPKQPKKLPGQKSLSVPFISVTETTGLG